MMHNPYYVSTISKQHLGVQIYKEEDSVKLLQKKMEALIVVCVLSRLFVSVWTRHIRIYKYYCDLTNKCYQTMDKCKTASGKKITGICSKKNSEETKQYYYCPLDKKRNSNKYEDKTECNNRCQFMFRNNEYKVNLRLTG
eukprot:TRINITY_DN1326_c0_g1_i2.p7 TRINITY_DN1326_c0_g1~~TRINITY_DN1326_c0_g1_i2.p7  ORF type:complete len:140 (+),score=4.74 TRINITY_DN1326_c0_g1_i2:1114-1533(+)